MIPVVWPGVPIEAIRQGASIYSAITLSRLAGIGAMFHPSAAVELTSVGFMASCRYTLPGAPDRVLMTTLGLVWHPSESLQVAGLRP